VSFHPSSSSSSSSSSFETPSSRSSLTRTLLFPINMPRPLSDIHKLFDVRYDDGRERRFCEVPGCNSRYEMSTGPSSLRKHFRSAHPGLLELINGEKKVCDDGDQHDSLHASSPSSSSDFLSSRSADDFKIKLTDYPPTNKRRRCLLSSPFSSIPLMPSGVAENRSIHNTTSVTTQSVLINQRPLTALLVSAIA
jgi:hypothetical protein